MSTTAKLIPEDDDLKKAVPPTEGSARPMSAPVESEWERNKRENPVVRGVAGAVNGFAQGVTDYITQPADNLLLQPLKGNFTAYDPRTYVNSAADAMVKTGAFDSVGKQGNAYGISDDAANSINQQGGYMPLSPEAQNANNLATPTSPLPAATVATGTGRPPATTAAPTEPATSVSSWVTPSTAGRWQGVPAARAEQAVSGEKALDADSTAPTGSARGKFRPALAGQNVFADAYNKTYGSVNDQRKAFNDNLNTQEANALAAKGNSLDAAIKQLKLQADQLAFEEAAKAAGIPKAKIIPARNNPVTGVLEQEESVLLGDDVIVPRTEFNIVSRYLQEPSVKADRSSLAEKVAQFNKLKTGGR